MFLDFINRKTNRNLIFRYLDSEELLDLRLVSKACGQKVEIYCQQWFDCRNITLSRHMLQWEDSPARWIKSYCYFNYGIELARFFLDYCPEDKSIVRSKPQKNNQLAGDIKIHLLKKDFLLSSSYFQGHLSGWSHSIQKNFDKPKSIAIPAHISGDYSMERIKTLKNGKAIFVIKKFSNLEVIAELTTTWCKYTNWEFHCIESDIYIHDPFLQRVAVCNLQKIKDSSQILEDNESSSPCFYIFDLSPYSHFAFGYGMIIARNEDGLKIIDIQTRNCLTQKDLPNLPPSKDICLFRPLSYGIFIFLDRNYSVYKVNTQTKELKKYFDVDEHTLITFTTDGSTLFFLQNKRLGVIDERLGSNALMTNIFINSVERPKALYCNKNQLIVQYPTKLEHFTLHPTQKKQKIIESNTSIQSNISNEVTLPEFKEYNILDLQDPQLIVRKQDNKKKIIAVLFLVVEAVSFTFAMIALFAALHYPVGSLSSLAAVTIIGSSVWIALSVSLILATGLVFGRLRK